MYLSSHISLSVGVCYFLFNLDSLLSCVCNFQFCFPCLISYECIHLFSQVCPFLLITLLCIYCLHLPHCMCSFCLSIFLFANLFCIHLLFSTIFAHKKLWFRTQFRLPRPAFRVRNLLSTLLLSWQFARNRVITISCVYLNLSDLLN